jgi:hypothetical protein
MDINGAKAPALNRSNLKIFARWNPAPRRARQSRAPMCADPMKSPPAGDKGAGVTSGSQICARCGKLNSREDARCFQCGARLPGGWGAAGRGWGSLLARPDAATTLFVVLSVVVYGALWLSGVGAWGAVHPIAALRWGALAGPLGSLEPWRYLSAMFVHFGLMHFGFNTLTLHQLGRELEGAVG